MPVMIHLEKLKDGDLHLSGEMPAEDLKLDLGGTHDLIRSAKDLHYELDASWADGSILVQGRLKIDFACDCARCIQPFSYTLDLTNWNTILPISGTDSLELIGEYVDLTPSFREDILLRLPSHPLCDKSCQGLVFQQETLPDKDEESSDEWGELENWKQQK
jgi:uncharacterized metal-binding protein YceD (DUF177 family)